MYIRVNGIDLWYEVRGSGSPIVLLHGNGESSEIFKVLISQLESSFTVYALDSRCHGKSGKSPELSYDVMAEDVAAFIRALGLHRPALYGFSDGGIVGLLLASKYPTLLSRLAVSGANTEPGAVKPFWLRLFQILYFFRRSPKTGLMLTEPHISDADLQRIEIPVLVLAGDRDMIKEENTRHIASRIGRSELHIIPKETHMSYVIKSPKLYKYLRDFIGAKE